MPIRFQILELKDVCMQIITTSTFLKGANFLIINVLKIAIIIITLVLKTANGLLSTSLFNILIDFAKNSKCYSDRFVPAFCV